VLRHTITASRAIKEERERRERERKKIGRERKGNLFKACKKVGPSHLVSTEIINLMGVVSTSK
jgi:hypothetical protein